MEMIETPIDEDISAPLPMDNINKFEETYSIEKEILNTDEFKLYIGKEKKTKKINKVIIKEYKEEFIKKLDNNDLFDFEKKILNVCNTKYVIKMDKIDKKNNCYQSKDKIIFVYEHFETTLRNEMKQKGKFKLDEIKYILIQINEAIKYLNQRNINEVIVSPDTIGINKKDNFYSINLFNLFPYYKLKNNSQYMKFKFNSLLYLSPEIPIKFNKKNCFDIQKEDLNDDKISKSLIRTTNTTSYLWNIGVLIYELYFGEYPFKKDVFENDSDIVLNLKQSESKDFDNLVSNLLIVDKDKRLKWDNYINHTFFLNLEPDKVYQNLYEKKINSLTEEIDLFAEEIYDDNIEILSRINFKNLLLMNLAHNHIESMEIFNKEVFKNLKVLILEKNEIKNVGSKNLLNSFTNLEILILSSNLIYSIYSLIDMKFNNLSYLSLSKNKIVDISFLSQTELTNLNTLNLSDNQIYDISSLEKMNFPYLEELNLKNNQIVNIDVFQKTNFPKLVILLLNNNSIMDINIFEKNIFENLEILNLEDNKIKNIQCLNNVSFKITLKELYLSNNPIEVYDSLNLCYFSSLKISDLSLSDKNLKFLSIKLKLYGYKMNNQLNNISILFVPFNLIKKKDFHSLNYKNSFKVIANKNNDIEEIKDFFFKTVLEMSDSEKDSKRNLVNFRIIPEEINNYNIEINNSTIFAYLDPYNIIKEKNKINTFYLINEYNILHEKINNYNKLPNFINNIDDIGNNTFKCPYKKEEDPQYLFPRLVDDNELLSYFLDKKYYYNKFPIIIINSDYYENILKFLENNKKYQFYKNNPVFLKMLISSINNYKYTHSKDKGVVAEVVENKDFYSYQIVNEIIQKIKVSLKGNYIKIINNYIITIFNLINEYLIFILKLNTYYYICPNCKNPILYINNYDKNKNVNQIIQEQDITLKKSVKICNNITKSLLSIFDNLSNVNLKNNDFINNKPKEYIPANPPKKTKFINVIYHDENYADYSDNINEDARQFRKCTNGTFIFSNSMDSFKTIINGIERDKKNKNNKFLLITTGSTFVKIYDFLKESNFLNYISNIGIYCMNKPKYEHLMENPQYPELKGIFTDGEEVTYFIEENSLETNKIFQILKLVTYKDYILKYYKLHQIISGYYINTENKESYKIAIDLLNEFLNNENKNDNEELFEGLKTFETNKEYEVITEYTGDRIYKKLNGWLLNLEREPIEKIAYFIGALMYKLNDYGMNYKKMNKENLILYRGICINYLDALSYQIYKGKIICFQTFFSSTKNEKTAEDFAMGDYKTDEEKKKDYQFSTIIEINNSYKEGLYPICFNISELSDYKDEEEYLFNPYNFFKLKDFSIDFEKNELRLKLDAINKKEVLEIQIKEGKKIVYNKKEQLIEITNDNKKNENEGNIEEEEDEESDE